MASKRKASAQKAGRTKAKVLDAGHSVQPQQEQSEPSLLRTPALTSFEKWMRDVGITWDPELVSFLAGAPGCGGAAWGVFAAADIPESAVLCTIPKTAILSVHTTACAEMLEKEFLRGGLGLIVAVMYERAIGEKSKWYGYIKSLPPREYVPMFWSEEELQLLQGTELEGKAEEDREVTQEDYEENVEQLADKYNIPKSHWRLADFQVAASWVASRAFFVDHWHGTAIVPLADLFNHKPSVVELTEEFEVAEMAGGGSSGGDDTDDDEDDDDEDENEEGLDEEDEVEEQEPEGKPQAAGHEHPHDQGCAEHACSHQHEHQEEAAQHQHHHSSCCSHQGCGYQHGHSGDKSHDGSDHGPGHPHSGGGATHQKQHHDQQQQQQQQQQASEAKPDGAGGRWPVLRDGLAYERDGVNLRLEIAICDVERNGEEVLEIVAASAVGQGCEIHNTYGEHGNAELLHKYGFALNRNPFNEVSLELQEVLEAAKAALGRQQQQQQQQQAGCTQQVQHKAHGKQATGKRQQQQQQQAQGRHGQQQAAAGSVTNGSVERIFRQRMRMLSNESSLLDPSSEPCLVMPGACISKPLLLLLHVLLAPSDQHSSLQDMIQGALGEEAAAAAAAGGRQAAQASKGGQGPFAHLVPLADVPTSTLTPAVQDTLVQVLSARLSRYPASLAATRDELAKLDATASTTARSEHVLAVRAALTLRLTELESLQQALDAVQESRQRVQGSPKSIRQQAANSRQKTGQKLHCPVASNGRKKRKS